MNLNKLLLFITTSLISLQLHATTIETYGYHYSNELGLFGHDIQIRHFYGGGVNSFLKKNEYQNLRAEGWKVANLSQITEMYTAFGMTLNETIINGRGIVDPKINPWEGLAITNQPKNYVDFINVFGDTVTDGDLAVGTYISFVDEDKAYQLRALIEEYRSSDETVVNANGNEGSIKVFSSSKSTLRISNGVPLAGYWDLLNVDEEVLLTRDLGIVLPEPPAIILILIGLFAISLRKLKLRKLES